MRQIEFFLTAGGHKSRDATIEKSKSDTTGLIITKKLK